MPEEKYPLPFVAIRKSSVVSGKGRQTLHFEHCFLTLVRREKSYKKICHARVEPYVQFRLIPRFPAESSFKKLCQWLLEKSDKSCSFAHKPKWNLMCSSVNNTTRRRHRQRGQTKQSRVKQKTLGFRKNWLHRIRAASMRK